MCECVSAVLKWTHRADWCLTLHLPVPLSLPNLPPCHLPPPLSSLPPAFYCSSLCSFSPVVQAMRETPALPLTASPHPPPITQEQSLLLVLLLLFSLALFFPRHHSLELLLHLPTNPLSFNQPPSPPLSTFHLPPSLGYLFASVPVLSQSFSPWLLAASPSSSFSLLTHSPPSLPPFASTLAAQDWEWICHFIWEKLTAICLCECYHWCWNCSIATVSYLSVIIKGLWRFSCCHNEEIFKKPFSCIVEYFSCLFKNLCLPAEFVKFFVKVGSQSPSNLVLIPVKLDFHQFVLSILTFFLLGFVS